MQLVAVQPAQVPLPPGTAPPSATLPPAEDTFLTLTGDESWSSQPLGVSDVGELPLEVACLELPAFLASELHQTTKVRDAMEWAMMPAPKVKTGDDCVAESEALSAIIRCVTQRKRGALVAHLLYEHDFSSFPPAGCAFSPNVLPPLMTAVWAYDTFEDKREWEEMFAALEDAGEIGARVGAATSLGCDYVLLQVRRLNRAVLTPIVCRAWWTGCTMLCRKIRLVSRVTHCTPEA